MKKRFRYLLTSCVFAGQLFVIGIIPAAPSYAADKRSSEINKRMVQRTERLCSAVLPEWLASNEGIRDPSVREITTKCYVHQARLSVFGIKTNFAPSLVDIVEVPAILLSLNTGINLDVFRPLSGIELKLRQSED